MYELIPHDEGQRLIAETLSRAWDRACLDSAEPEEIIERLAEAMAALDLRMAGF